MGNPEYVLSAGLEFFFAVVSLILLAGCLLDHDRQRRTNRALIAILLIHALMNTVDAFVWLWCDLPEMLVIVKIFSFLSYALGCAIIAMFSLLLIISISEYTPVPGWIKKAILGLSGFMALLWVISLFNDMYYYWDENGTCQTGDLFWVSQIFGVIIFVGDILLVLIYRKALKKRDATVLFLYSALPLLAYAFVPLWEVLPLYTASTIALLMFYIIVHVEHGQRIADQEVQLVRQELELTNSQTSIVLTQIQPHFLYNTLNTIAYLCERDPKRAKEITLNFSEYLRQNMESMNLKGPIPFKQELAHVKHYLSIEQVRFTDELRVFYWVRATDFLIPALSLQAIVENAVKHGVGMKEGGGTVTISTGEAADHYEIVVTDTGVGFDMDKTGTDAERQSGMHIVKTRLEKMVGGTLEVKSRSGIGTKVTICIPKE